MIDLALRGNAPVFLTPLLGREQDVERVCTLLQRPEMRVLTLVGPGGVGKTRLALAVATRLSASFDDGACFVSLAPISDPQLVLSALAQQLDVKEVGERSALDLLISALRERHLLLVLDNMEQVAAAAPRLSELLASCPRLKLLITSRAVLRLDGEHTFSVSPLALPNLQQLPAQEELAQQASVALFLQRAQAMQLDFLLTDANAQEIAEICVRLDGLPLALELAAARIRLLPPPALLARLAQRLSILTRGTAALPARQQTLRRTLQWSYDLLDVHEQRLFRYLSIFVGGFTLEAAEAVCGALREDGQSSVMDGVDSLLEKSLLYQVQQHTDEPHLAMLETIREYGLECLAASGELESSRQAHSMYYHSLAHEARLHFRSPDKMMWLDQLEREKDNLRAALNWLLSQDKVEQAVYMCNDLLWFWWHGYPREGRLFFERALAAQGSVARDLLGWAWQALGILVSNQGNFVNGTEVTQTSLALFQGMEGTVGTLGRAWALSNIGTLAMYQGEYTRARQILEESLALFRELEDQGNGDLFLAAAGSVPLSGGAGFSLYRLAWIANLQGEYARARVLAEESLPFLRAARNSFGLSQAMEILVSASLNQGDYTAAQEFLAENLTLSQKNGIKRVIGTALCLQGQLAFLQGEMSRAQAQLEESIAILHEVASSWMPSQDTLAEALSILGRVVTRQGNFARAQTLHEESLAAARHMANPRFIALSLEGLAETAVAQGKPAWAARLWGLAELLRESRGTPLPAAWQPDYERSVAAVRAVLGEQTFSALWSTGRTLPLEQVLAEREPVPFAPPASAIVLPASPASVAGLTPREMDVLRLLAQGLTSAQIAEQLVVSLVTVNSHVRSIYSKLGVTSRSAATRYAIEHKLV